MANRMPLIDDDEVAALGAAIAESDADPRTAPHEQVRAWLLRLAEGEFDAPPEPLLDVPVWYAVQDRP